MPMPIPRNICRALRLLRLQLNEILFHLKLLDKSSGILFFKKLERRTKFERFSFRWCNGDYFTFRWFRWYHLTDSWPEMNSITSAPGLSPEKKFSASFVSLSLSDTHTHALSLFYQRLSRTHSRTCATTLFLICVHTHFDHMYMHTHSLSLSLSPQPMYWLVPPPAVVPSVRPLRSSEHAESTILQFGGSHEIESSVQLAPKLRHQSSFVRSFGWSSRDPKKWFHSSRF